MDLKLRDKVVVVTGASRGIGAATTRMLAEEGARTLLVARRAAELEEVAAQCRGETATLALDVTQPDAAERVIASCLERLGRIDGLVNNAGSVRVSRPDQITDDYWSHQLSLNVMAPMRLMRAAAPRMAETGGGRIVNVCSMASRQPSQLDVAYSVAKAAEMSLSRAFADQWAPQGVLVNAVTPGVIGSPMWLGDGGIADQVAAAEGTGRDKVIADAEQEAMTGRIGRVDEVAAVIVFLCSELASNVAGAAWSVDGGAVRTMM